MDPYYLWHPRNGVGWVTSHNYTAWKCILGHSYRLLITNNSASFAFDPYQNWKYNLKAESHLSPTTLHHLSLTPTGPENTTLGLSPIVPITNNSESPPHNHLVEFPTKTGPSLSQVVQSTLNFRNPLGGESNSLVFASFSFFYSPLHHSYYNLPTFLQ